MHGSVNFFGSLVQTVQLGRDWEGRNFVEIASGTYQAVLHVFLNEPPNYVRDLLMVVIYETSHCTCALVPNADFMTDVCGPNGSQGKKKRSGIQLIEKQVLKF